MRTVQYRVAYIAVGPGWNKGDDLSSFTFWVLKDKNGWT